ncbi:hypothetical protein Glove_108g18 [Diversispora epigaea]|uniref:DUF4112 domain-containing protein n=1 Tax=Diversispora epigaea TaxID=1348612 RepID=A0A397J6E4_9GLOM|nr:hypothetical protein Glove_108g18 [Diversispora epigaea]
MVNYYLTKVAKTVIKHTLGNMANSSVRDLPPQEDPQILTTTHENDRITPGGKIKKNKWNIPPNLTPYEAKILTKVKKGASLLDYGYCFCCCCKVGLDPIIGLIPVIGDFLGVFLALSLINTAKKVDLPKHVIVQMFFNIFVDWLLGLIPVIGDFVDFLYKANIRNSILLEEFLVDRARNRSVVIEDGSIEVIRASQLSQPSNVAQGPDRSGRF